jgi:PAS domain S-box-containing protein
MILSLNLKIYHFIILGSIVLLLDILKPLEYNDWIVYCFLLGFASKFSKRDDLYLLGLIYTVFILTAFFLSQNYESQAVQTHMRGIAMLWFLTYLLGKLKSKHFLEEKLRKENEHIYNRIDEIIFGLDKNYNVTYKNSAADKMGYNFINIGDNFFEKLPKTVGTDQEYYLKKAMSTQKPMTFTYETQYTATPRTIIFSVYPSEDGLSVFSKDITEIKEAQEKVEAANERINTILNRINDAFWAIDLSYYIIYANNKMIELIGKSEDEIIGKNLWEALPQLKNTVVEEKFKEAIETQQNIKFEMKSIAFPDTYFSLSISPSNEGLTIYAQDISQYKETRIKLQQALEEKNLLLQELNHRVKNNLQIVTSIMNLKLDQIEDFQAKSVIEDIIKRIQGISIVHSKLYDAGSSSYLNLSDYIRELVDHLISSYEKFDVDVKMDLTDVRMDIKHAAPVGMIINELMSNSIKYGCVENLQCNIDIACNQDNGLIKLIVKDNGKGYPERIEDKNTLGIMLVKHFAEQLDAQIIMENRNGAYNEIVFPHKDKI